MNLTLSEINHILTALNTMSTHDIARSRELISSGVTNHDALIDKVKAYRYRLTQS